MTTETVYLRQDDRDITLTTYISADEPELKMPPRPAILVFPGGGYSFLSDREAEPIAKAFFGAGFQAFVLRYSIGEKAVFPRPLVDASLAMAHIRTHAQAYNIDPARVFVIGFSAGGHLAASLGTMYDDPMASFPGMEPGINRPTGMILSYAVTCVDMKKIVATFVRAVGGDLTREKLDRISPAERVSAATVPAFIWHTADDPVVPVEHALTMASRLAACGVPFEAHIFPAGPHGLSLATGQTCSARDGFVSLHVAQWFSEAVDWTRRV